MTIQEDENQTGERSSFSPVEIFVEETPNPRARKFILNRDVKVVGKVSYTEAEDCSHVTLAYVLLKLPNITQVHFFEDVITVTQNGVSDWPVLEEAVKRLVQQYIEDHDPDFVEFLDSKNKPKDRSTLSTELQEIEAILDRTIRPGLQADGGDVEVVELDGQVLSVRYQGACGGCPSSTMGTLQAIESILRNEFHPYLEVVAL